MLLKIIRLTYSQNIWTLWIACFTEGRGSYEMGSLFEVFSILLLKVNIFYSLQIKIITFFNHKNIHGCDWIYVQILFHPQFEVAIFSTFCFVQLYISVQPCAYARIQLKIITITWFKLYVTLVYTFFKSYISNICNDFFIYIMGFVKRVKLSYKKFS